MSSFARDVTDLVGRTPVLRVSRLDVGRCELFLKMESANPGGSIKDGIGLSMIAAAEASGAVGPHNPQLVEATAGNTGLGLALVASQRGYRLTLVIPDKMSQEKVHHLKALGAEVVMTRSDVEKGHPDYYQDLAETIARKRGAFYVNQFNNPANPRAHETTTGPEILEQLDGRIDAMVCGVGSGGTITGLSAFFGANAPSCEMVLADPEGSVLAEYVRTGTLGKAGSWVVEGIGEDFIPPICDLSRVRHAYTISDEESLHTARELLRLEGVLGGSSTGTLLAAALRYCRAQSEPKRVCTLVCDSGNKYLSKMFNEYWMIDQGFIRREASGTLRDLVVRRFSEGSVVTVSPADTALTAYGRMRLYDVSQLPVLDGERVVGIVDESDVLAAALDDENGLRVEVRSLMSTRLSTVDVRTDVRDLLPLLNAGLVPIVMDGEQFVGFITRIDLLNHLRRRARDAH